MTRNKKASFYLYLYFSPASRREIFYFFGMIYKKYGFDDYFL